MTSVRTERGLPCTAHSLALTGVVDADGLFVLAHDRGDGTNGVGDADLAIDSDFQNAHQTQVNSKA